MIQGVEEALDVGLDHPASTHTCESRPEGLTRLASRATRTETVGAFREDRLVRGLQYHRHRSLENLVLDGGDADGSGFGSVAFRDVSAPDRRCLVTTGLEPVE